MKKYWIGIVLCLLLSNLQAQFSKGVIVDQHGGVYAGYLKNPGREKLVFKESRNGKREVLTVNDLRAFKINQDSFLVLKNYRFPLDDIEQNGFAKVILSGNGGIVCTFNELKVTTTGSSISFTTVTTTKIIHHYLIFKKDQVIELTDYNFYYEMPPLISDNETLHQKVVSKQLQFKQIDELALKYEQEE